MLIKMRKIIIILILATVLFVNVSQIVVAKNNEIPFTLPKNGGGMAHSDQKMSDFCYNIMISLNSI